MSISKLDEMKNQIYITVNGVGFNCEVVAQMSEDDFLTKEMPLKLQRTPIAEREAILKDIYKMCIDKVNTAKGDLKAEELPVDNLPGGDIEGESLKEISKENKKGRGKNSIAKG